VSIISLYSSQELDQLQTINLHRESGQMIEKSWTIYIIDMYLIQPVEPAEGWLSHGSKYIKEDKLCSNENISLKHVLTLCMSMSNYW